MKSTPQNNDLIAALRAAAFWMDERKTPYVVVGGIAASVLGEPRQTRDVDLVAAIVPDEVQIALQQARGLGLTPAHPDSLALARQYNMLRMLHEKNDVCIDSFLAATPFEHDIIDSGSERARCTETLEQVKKLIRI